MQNGFAEKLWIDSDIGTLTLPRAMSNDCGVVNCPPPCVSAPDAEQVQRQYLLELGDTELCDIEVIPFSHDAFGTAFGLIAQPPEEDDEEWTVIA